MYMGFSVVITCTTCTIVFILMEALNSVYTNGSTTSKQGCVLTINVTFMYCHLHVLPPSCTATFMYCHPHVLPPSCTANCHPHVLPPSCTATFMYCHLHVLPPSCTATFMYCHLHVLPSSCTATFMYCHPHVCCNCQVTLQLSIGGSPHSGGTLNCGLNFS